ncbi:uncharacterized protein LOC143465193 [Clavelina lepadiformis]|uniref:uncharacterized protein LOC143465193 n=1 Tax=Clavelina lepadiformis TaxID=159417 RepID=UPI00404264CE
MRQLYPYRRYFKSSTELDRSRKGIELTKIFYFQRNKTMREFIFFVSVFIYSAATANEITGRLQDLCTSHPCHHFATCTSDGQDYTCTCQDGFFGDGFLCGRINHCDGRCHQQAKCEEQDGRHRCVCNEGFVGSGFGCKRESLVCQRHLCHAQADCDASKDRKCSCKPGYCGDGRFCTRNKCYSNNCHKDAVCIPHEQGCNYECRCKPGFTGNGVTCAAAENKCLNSRCHRDATCQPHDNDNGYSCTCNKGYYGDGYQCRRVVTKSLSLPRHLCRTCHKHATCFIGRDQNKYSCRCKKGYCGTGDICRDKKKMCGYLTCPSQAKCVVHEISCLPRCNYRL